MTDETRSLMKRLAVVLSTYMDRACAACGVERSSAITSVTYESKLDAFRARVDVRDSTMSAYFSQTAAKEATSLEELVENSDFNQALGLMLDL